MPDGPSPTVYPISSPPSLSLHILPPSFPPPCFSFRSPCIVPEAFAVRAKLQEFLTRRESIISFPAKEPWMHSNNTPSLTKHMPLSRVRHFSNLVFRHAWHCMSFPSHLPFPQKNIPSKQSGPCILLFGPFPHTTYPCVTISSTLNGSSKHANNIEPADGTEAKK